MEGDNVVRFTEDQFLHTTEPYDYLVGIASATERDHEIAVYKKFALKSCGISAKTFKDELRKAQEKRDEKTLPDESSGVSVTKFTGQPLTLKCPGYICNDSGVWKELGIGMSPICVCPHPIMPVRQIINYESHEHRTEIIFRRSYNGGWSTVIVPRSVLASRTGIVKWLSEVGALIDSENCGHAITYFSRLEAMNKLPSALSTSQMGWNGDKFLPYDDGLEFDGNDKFREMRASIHEHGDKAKWFDLAAQVRRGNSVVARVMLATSFASVLIGPLKLLPFILHCWSDVSGTGKTVGLMFAASVWADPNEGRYVKNMNTTDVGVEMTAGFLGSLPLCLDELCLKDQAGRRDTLESLVYQFCEGVGRTRGSRVGGIQQQQKWRCCAITNGETPINSDSNRAGAANRVLELAVDDVPLFADSIAAADTVRANYGFAGKMFVDALKQDGALEQVRKLQKDYFVQLLSYDTTEKQAMAISVILAADRFASLKLFDDTYWLRPEDFAPLMKSRDEVDTNLRAYNWLMDTVAMNNARFEPTDDHYNGEVWGKLVEDPVNPVVCIVNARLSELLKAAGYNDRSFLRWARRVGVIECDVDGKSTKRVRLSRMGSTQTRCACIRMNAFDNAEQKKSHLGQQISSDQAKNFAPDDYSQVEMKEEDLPF